MRFGDDRACGKRFRYIYIIGVIPQHESTWGKQVPDFTLAGERYNDDRMFVLHIARCSVVERDGMIETTIHHDDPPHDARWCLVSYRNTARLPAYRVDHFDSREAAQRYLEEVAPSVPLVSLGGRSPYPPMTFPQYEAWERANGLRPCDPLSMFTSGGSNARELITQLKKTDEHSDRAV